MKILSCHIENFGKLSNCDFEFGEGVNCFCEDNGWGKSTFASFLKAMFYGFEGEKKRSIENERKRFQPWQGGPYGGSLTFETGGREYVVTRMFGDKELNDSFELRDGKTNLISGDYSYKIGEELFNINSEAFARTLFISQNGCETRTNDDINAKVGNLVDNTNDLNSFEKVDNYLRTLLNEMNPGRKTGSIAKRKNQISQQEMLVKNGAGTADNIEAYNGLLRKERDNLKNLCTEMEENKKLQKQLAEHNSFLVIRDRFNNLRAEAEKHKNELEKIKAELPRRLPRLEEIDEWINSTASLYKMKERMETYSLTVQEKNKLEILESGLEGQNISLEEIDEKLEKNARLQKICQGMNLPKLTPDEKLRMVELMQEFASDELNPSEAITLWNERCNRKATLSGQRVALDAMKAKAADNGKKSPNITFMIIGILAVVGAAGLVFASKIAGITVCLAGVVSIIASYFFGSKIEDEGQEAEIASLEKAASDAEKEIEETDEKIKKYLNSHKREFVPANVLKSLQDILTDSSELAALQKRAAQDEEGSADDNAEKAEALAIIEEIEVFFGRKADENATQQNLIRKDYSSQLYELKLALNEYHRLVQKNESFRRAEDEYRQLYSEADEFVRECGLEPQEDIAAQLTAIRRYADEYYLEKKLFEEALGKLQQFCNENDMDALQQADEAEGIDIREVSDRFMLLSEEAEIVRKRIHGYEKTIGELQDNLEQWEESKRVLQNLKELQEAEEQKYRLLTITRKKMEQAKQSLVSNYVGPLMKSFLEYSSDIAGTEATGFHMDSDINITVDELGKQRNTENLSNGLRDMVGICLRIAFADAMFQGEKPFLLFDDSFVNLDDDKMNGIRMLMKTVSERYQVIYFTCSRSRKID